MLRRRCLMSLQSLRIVREGRLDAAHNVAAVDVEHGVHVLVARGPHQHWRGERIAARGIGRSGVRAIRHSRTT
jgi:hypothetical protein